MEHIYKENKKGAPVFILLHGTGGTENDLVPVAQLLNPDYNILGIRGNVQENGMNRYFKRHGEGKYDWEDLEFRGNELYEFITEKAEEYGFKLEDAIPVGFSNGSNIAIQMMLRHPDAFKKAALFAPLYPADVEEKQDFSDVEVFLSLGKGDPIVPESESERVINLFEERGADVTTAWVQGHTLTEDVARKAKEWLNK
ncbi:carboxylesterase [Salimicrobium jeotgali]|uniref:Carboxylesterase n=1 Tax=Salimicrobium jeotgali TaxID=1230341 RepID=K2GPS2_9BACI|nr:alpha/beta hydrolase [Salimicrobium jeotgali]AKG05228.1 carboxylesterase [Salimicrobium jeotgali]EKE32389.1 phospholipase/carboxylesterase [Salimicrobium jeotgali]MBM7695632.1 phospholipase/carboxylesterase [Salimicrobium jeotgali]